MRVADDGRPVAVLEQGYADHFDLQDRGSLTVSGDQRLDYVGTGTSPQHFIVTGSRGMLFAEAGFATVFVPLHTAQQLLGRSGQVNEVVLRVSDAADLATLQREVSAALPGTGLSFTRRAEEPAVRMLYEDIDNDQQFWNVIAGLVLAGAAFAAFNLISRMIEAQRRQLGVGMALGTPTRLLVVRPLLVGVQIALLGMVAGVAVGHLLDIWLAACSPRSCRCRSGRRSSWECSPRPQRWDWCAGPGRGAAGVASPAGRAGRGHPHRAPRPFPARPPPADEAGPAGRSRPPPDARARHPPLPRRSLLTALAIGAAITTMVATIGLVDSFVTTLDRGEAEATHEAADRFVVELDGFDPTDAPSCAGWRRCPRWPRSSRG